MIEIYKIVKYLSIGFAVFLIISIISGIFQIGGIIIGSFDKLDNEKFETIQIDEEFNDLDIDINSSQLVIKKSDTFKIENNNKYIIVKQNLNELSIKEENHNIIKTPKNSKIIIYIPENRIFENINISNGAGTIDIDYIKSKNLDVEIGTGKLNINEIYTLNSTEIKGGVGEVYINNANFNNLNLEAGVGKFTLNAKLNGLTYISSGIGELNVNLYDSKDNYTIYVETGIGSINIDGDKIKKETIYGNGANKINVEGGIGSVNINFNR